MKGPCIGGAIAHLTGHDLRGATIGEGKAGAGCQRQLATHDAIATHKVTFKVKEVH